MRRKQVQSQAEGSAVIVLFLIIYWHLAETNVNARINIAKLERKMKFSYCSRHVILFTQHITKTKTKTG